MARRELGEVCPARARVAQLRRSEALVRALEDAVAPRQLFGTGDDGIRDARHERLRLRGQRVEQAPLGRDEVELRDERRRAWARERDRQLLDDAAGPG